MATFRLLSKEERIDPGVNLDSCGEDSDQDAPNNEKLQPTRSGGVPGPLSDEAVHNNLSCQCSGIKCVCHTRSVTALPHGGPDGDPPSKKGTCEGFDSGRLEEEDQENCLGSDTTVYYANNDTFECGKDHWLCANCFKLDYCPVDAMDRCI